ncbi:MAG: hypothetical protein MUE75_06235 [Algoriphagus sp.]|nr:hypothetical protein [Algoriphagus sp.]
MAEKSVEDQTHSDSGRRHKTQVRKERFLHIRLFMRVSARRIHIPEFVHPVTTRGGEEDPRSKRTHSKYAECEVDDPSPACRK